MTSEAVRELIINATPQRIFPYLVDQKKLVEWMGTEATLNPVPGGAFNVLCRGVHPAAGEFEEVAQNERVVFSFGWDLPGHPIPAGSTQVEITLTPRGDATLLRLVHRGLPEDAVTDHLGGWDFYLARLGLVLEGIDPGPEGPTTTS